MAAELSAFKIQAIDRPFAMYDGSSPGEVFRKLIAIFIEMAADLNNALSSRSPSSAFERVKHILKEAWIDHIMQSASLSPVAVLLQSQPTVAPEALLQSLGVFETRGRELSQDRQDLVAEVYPFGGLYVAGLQRRVRGEMRPTRVAMMIGIVRISGTKTALVDNLFNAAIRWCKTKRFKQLLVCPYPHLMNRLVAFGFKKGTRAEWNKYAPLIFGGVRVSTICGYILITSL